MNRRNKGRKKLRVASLWNGFPLEIVQTGGLRRLWRDCVTLRCLLVCIYNELHSISSRIPSSAFSCLVMLRWSTCTSATGICHEQAWGLISLRSYKPWPTLVSLALPLLLLGGSSCWAWKWWSASCLCCEEESRWRPEERGRSAVI